jgi:FHA domain
VTAPGLFLIHGTESVSLGQRGIALGRLPECDVMLDGWEVSRRHARIVPTPAGPVLVDRSRFGTFVNNVQVIAPQRLVDGDVVRIGSAELRIASTPATGLLRDGSPPRSRLAKWWRRYGPSEIGGAIAALVGALGALKAGGGIIVAALSGTAAEVLWFYASLAVRDLSYEAHEQRAAGRPFDSRAAGDVLRNLWREFGAAEAVDLLLRPLCLGAGLSTLGGVPGVLVGKLFADLLFYGPVLRIWHWRTARQAPSAIEPHRLRPTTAAELPVSRLAELHLRLDAETTDRPEIPSSQNPDR